MEPFVNQPSNNPDESSPSYSPPVPATTESDAHSLLLPGLDTNNLVGRHRIPIPGARLGTLGVSEGSRTQGVVCLAAIEQYSASEVVDFLKWSGLSPTDLRKLASHRYLKRDLDVGVTEAQHSSAEELLVKVIESWTKRHQPSWGMLADIIFRCDVEDRLNVALNIRVMAGVDDVNEDLRKRFWRMVYDVAVALENRNTELRTIIFIFSTSSHRHKLYAVTEELRQANHRKEFENIWDMFTYINNHSLWNPSNYILLKTLIMFPQINELVENFEQLQGEMKQYAKDIDVFQRTRLF